MTATATIRREPTKQDIDRLCDRMAAAVLRFSKEPGALGPVENNRRYAREFYAAVVAGELKPKKGRG